MSDKYIGNDVPQADSWLKVTGTLKYAFDVSFPGMLYAKLVTSKMPHAKIKGIDITEAMKVKGVVNIATGRDFPYRLGLYLSDRDVLAVDKVRWVGHPVAAVVADSLQAAEEAAEKVSVEYEQLEPVLTVERAMEKDSPLIHEKLGEYRVFPGFKPVPGTNIANVFELKHGDAEEALKGAYAVIEDTFMLPQISHAALETQNVLAWWRFDNYIELWTSIQSPFSTRYLAADALMVPVNRVIVHAPPAGGGFGLKAGLGWEPLVALLSRKAGNRPVKLVLSRAEQMISAPSRDGFLAKVKAGFTRDGRFIAYQAEFILDAGAYADYTINVARTAGYSADGAYDIPNVHVRSLAVYTNKIPTTAMRGFGHPENHWPLEQILDRAASRLGIDPVEIRRINLLRPGESVRATGDRVRQDEGDPQKVLQELARAIDISHVEKPSEPWKVRAKGISLLVKAPSQPPSAGASAMVKLNEDGTVDVLTGNGSMGQGTPTSLAIIAAEGFGIPLEMVKINQLEMVSTDTNPYTWQTVGSRGLFSDGTALLRAIEDAKAQIRDTASRVFKVPVEDVEVSGGYAYSITHPWIRKEIREFAMGYTYPDGTTIGSPVIGRGSYAPVLNTFLDSSGHGSNTVFHTYGGTGVELEIDLLTFDIKVIKAVQVFDVGRAIDKLMLECQMDGGFIMGMGSALFEEIKFDDQGWVLNPNFTHYYVPRMKDVGGKIDKIILETPQGDGPFGARGIGEHVMIAVAPAIANAIYRAIGVKVNELPITAEKLWRAIREQKPELIEKATKSFYGEKIQEVSSI
ncbi:MAG: xanthine dehydrogenase family protein molybdopterin-binding subunit [Nitrososphaerota archaeon]|nr:xanthine dehydrogenase family protein molybdopterin-binding subunit [Nitrososphaerota archaeon]